MLIKFEPAYLMLHSVFCVVRQASRVTGKHLTCSLYLCFKKYNTKKFASFLYFKLGQNVKE